MASMANNKLRLCEFNQRDMLPIFGGNAMPIDSWNAAPRRLASGFIVMAHGISVPISWGSPPILQRMNR
jgi:hypothetical protein